MKIAIMAHRGIPASFGGSETAIEEIGQRLVEMGHEVIVYCRKHNSKTDAKMYKGMQRIVLPSINTKGTDMLSYTFLSIWHSAIFHKVDVIHFHGVGAALLFPTLKVLCAAGLFWSSMDRTGTVPNGGVWHVGCSAARFRWLCGLRTQSSRITILCNNSS